MYMNLKILSEGEVMDESTLLFFLFLDDSLSLKKLHHYH